MNNATGIAGNILRLVEPGSTVEMRILRSVGAPSVGHYKADADGIRQMCSAAMSWSDDTSVSGIYFTLNPLPADWIGTPAKDGDIARRRTVLVDIDPKRPGSVASTDAEKEAAREKAESVREFLMGLGWPAPVIADSGNGWHLLNRIELEADDGGLVARVLKSLSAMFSDSIASIDTKVGNASRICRMYGSVSRKGEDTPDRPHRVSQIVDFPDDWEDSPVSREQLEELAGQAEPAGGVPLSGLPARQATSVAIDPDRIDRASKYLATVEAAISGEHGHDKLLRAASVLVNDFALSDADALDLLACEYNPRCIPPWSEADISRKISEAKKKPPSRPSKAARAERLVDLSAFSLASGDGEEVGPEDFDASLQFQPFPVYALPECLAEFVSEGAAAIGCDPSFIALPILSVCGAAIGNAARLCVKPGWLAPPILWTAVIGDSGTAKTPAFRLAMAPVRALQHASLKAHEESEREHQTMLAFHKKRLAEWERSKTGGDPPEKPAEPAAKRYHVSDTTTEALAPILAANPRGLLMSADELSGWFGSFDRYSNGGGDAANWLSMFNAETITIDRKTGTPKTLSVPDAAVCVTGGIQPGIIRRAMSAEHRESGMAARFLLTMPPRLAKCWSDAGIDPMAEMRYASIVNRLYGVPFAVEDDRNEPHVLTLSPGAKAAFVAFYDRHGREQADLSGDLAAAWAKLEEYAARIALVFHFVRFAADDPSLASQSEVDEQSMSEAIRLVEWFKHEAKRVYRMLSATEEEETGQKLIDFIRRKGGRVTARDVQRGPNSMRKPGVAEPALESLVARGFGRWDESHSGKGRVFILSQ